MEHLFIVLVNECRGTLMPYGPMSQEDATTLCDEYNREMTQDNATVLCLTPKGSLALMLAITPTE